MGWERKEYTQICPDVINSVILLYQNYFLIEKVLTETQSNMIVMNIAPKTQAVIGQMVVKSIEICTQNKMEIFLCWDNLHIVFKLQKHSKKMQR